MNIWYVDVWELFINITIALIAVDISIYAIAIPLLQKELKMNFLYLERRLKDVNYELSELNKKKDAREAITEIEVKIKEFKKEEKKYSFMLSCLRLKGAVIFPSSSFAISILFTIFFNNLSSELLSFFSDFKIINITLFDILHYLLPITFFIYGLYRILCTLNTIDFASANIPLPDIDISFIGDKVDITLKGGKIQEVPLGIVNNGYDIGEYIDVMINLQPSFNILPSEEYSVYKESEFDSEYPKWWRVFYNTDYLHIDTGEKFTLIIEPPNITQSFEIPVWIAESKSNQKEFKLIINVEAN